jgi:hypothetical protein
MHFIFELAISKRAADWVKITEGVKAAMNVKTTPLAEEEVLEELSSYYPAQFVARNGANQAAVESDPSRITGKKYKTKFKPSDQGYTVPFGTNSTGAITMAAAQNTIKAVPSLQNYAVRFIPEEYTPPAASYSWT